MERFDTHTHVISPNTERYPQRPLGGHFSGWSQERPVTAEQLLEQMDLAGVDKAVVVQASTAYGFDNHYAADALGIGGDRFVGVCSVDLLDENAIASLRHWIGDQGFGGVRVRASDGATPVPQQGEGLDDPRTFPAWAFVEERNIPACLQIHPTEIPKLRNLISHFPDLTVLLDHCGRPPIESGPPFDDAAEYFRMSEMKNVYLKLTPVLILRAMQVPGGAGPVISALVENFGADHLAWGSNFPASKGTLSELVQLSDEAFTGISPSVRATIYAGTAQSVYPALASRSR